MLTTTAYLKLLAEKQTAWDKYCAAEAQWEQEYHADPMKRRDTQISILLDAALAVNRRVNAAEWDMFGQLGKNGSN